MTFDHLFPTFALETLF